MNDGQRSRIEDQAIRVNQGTGVDGNLLAVGRLHGAKPPRTRSDHGLVGREFALATNMSVTTAFEELAAWIEGAATQAVDAKLVPGASLAERRRLGALGGVVRELVRAQSLASWPPDLTDWLSLGPSVPAAVIDAAELALADEPDSVLANLYARLVSGVNRRLLGTFFTPAPEVELMLDMWESNEAAPATVVDVGAGVGVFTASAASRWPSAAIYGVDVNPVTLGMLALRVAGHFPLVPEASGLAGIRLVRDDYTAWIGEASRTIQGPRLILGNPPYTRAQLLSVEDRVRLTQAAGGLCGSRASLSTLITAISLRHLGPDDGLCLLLPAQWLESQYAQPLREHLAHLSRRRVELRLVDSWRFVDAQVDAVALLVGRERETSQRLCVANWRSEESRSVERATLGAREWRSLFAGPSSLVSLGGTTPSDDAPPSLLSNYCTVRRGVATGANEFFVLNDEEASRHSLPRSRLLPLARRLFNFNQLLDAKAFDALPSNEKRWLLNADRKHRISGSALDRYLCSGEESGFDERTLCRSRKGEWYDLRHDIVFPDVIVGPMTRERIRIVENVLCCAITNNLYGWRWRDGVPKKTRALILSWLRSVEGQVAMLASARRQGDGLFKLEPTAIANLEIPVAVARPPITPI